MKINNETSKPTKEQMKKALLKIIQYQRSQKMNSNEKEKREASQGASEKFTDN